MIMIYIFFDNDSNDMGQNTNNANTFFDINDDELELILLEIQMKHQLN